MQKINSILELDNKKAQTVLMSPRQYVCNELPEYYDFSAILKFVQNIIGSKPYEDCLSEVNPTDIDGINHILLNNKDGRYGIRPITICNPFMYYFLCRELCTENNWNIFLQNLKECSTPNIEVCSIPIIPKCNEPFRNSTVILHWWNKMEQQAIELSLQYDQMFVTDITNCYGSITHQSIQWALTRRNTSKATSADQNISFGRNIVRLLSDMQHGATIGLPQGSTLFDLIGDIVLAYSDLLLHEALVGQGIANGYKILRYRDDYKIFCNDSSTLNTITRTLQGVLESLNFRMNAAKTMVSHSLITDSIKSDKLDYIYNTPIYNKCRFSTTSPDGTIERFCFDNYDFDSLQKHLLYILLFGRQHPNCGQLKNMLSQFDNRLKNRCNEYKIDKILRKSKAVAESGDKHDAFFKHRYGFGMPNIPNHGLGDDAVVLCAIGTQIALENVSSAPQALVVVANILSNLDSQKKKREVCQQIARKVKKLHNSNYIQIWAQQLTIVDDRKNCIQRFEEPLCALATGQKTSLWNNDWLKPELLKRFNYKMIIDQRKIKNINIDSDLFSDVSLMDNETLSEYVSALTELNKQQFKIETTPPLPVEKETFPSLKEYLIF